MRQKFVESEQLEFCARTEKSCTYTNSAHITVYTGLSYSCINAGRTASGFIWNLLFWKPWKPSGVSEALVCLLVEDFSSAILLCTNVKTKKKQTIWNCMCLLILSVSSGSSQDWNTESTCGPEGGYPFFIPSRWVVEVVGSGNHCFLAFAQPSCFGIIRSWKCTVTKSLLYRIQTFLSTPGFNLHFQCQRSAD